MPLPFFIAPGLSYVVSSIAAATGYSGATVVGAGVGGAGVGGVGAWFFGRSGSNAHPLPKEYEEWLKDQQKATEQRIGEVDANQDERAKIANASRTKTNDSLSKSVESREALEKSIATFGSKTNGLSATATTVATAGQSFFNAMPSLKEISAETIHASKEARTDLQAHISQMESLTQTTDSTQSMVSTIDKQTENTERLTEELAQSRAEAALLKSQLDSIKKENALVKQNLQFFKEATKTLMAKQQLLTTDVGALTTQEVMPK